MFDPNIQLDNIRGANNAFALVAIPHIGRLMRGVDEVMVWSDLLVIAQKPAVETASLIRSSGLPVIDLVSCAQLSYAAAAAATVSLSADRTLYGPAGEHSANYGCVIAESMLEGTDIPDAL
jgi:hypothetical protein